MTKELESLREIKEEAKERFLPWFQDWLNKRLDLIETSLKGKEVNDFELEVFKLAYEWKCNGVEGTYEEVLNQARKTVEGWKEIEKKGYGEVIDE